MPRLHVDPPLQPGPCALSDDAARHLRVLRLNAGAPLTLFDGTGGEWLAEVIETRRDAVHVQVLKHEPVEREANVAVHLALGMPANERMDTLVEKATEMGVASIQPLLTSRSVLRLSGERAARKVAHWQAIAVAACEQSGRNRVPLIHPVMTLSDWLTKGLTVDAAAQRWVLDPREAVPLWPIQPSASATATSADASHPSAIVLSGPEGGLSAEELALARTPGGFTAVSLGARVLRADTAPLAALLMLTLPR